MDAVVLREPGKRVARRRFIGDGDSDVLEVVLGAAWREQHQHPAACRARSVPVRNTLRQENEPACARDNSLLATRELIVAVQDVERLVDTAMEMPGRAGIGRVDGLDK